MAASASLFTPTERLNSWLEHGYFETEYPGYLAANILAPGADSFYARILREQGREAAQAALQRWETGLRMADFASAIKPAVLGMRDLALIDDTPVRLVRESDFRSERNGFPRRHGKGKGDDLLVIAFNVQAPGCGCAQPEQSDVFGPYGRLGLIAVTIQASNLASDRNVQLGLVLQSRHIVDGAVNHNGYTVLTVDNEGHTDAHTYQPRMQRGTYLMYSLGLLPPGRVFSTYCQSGGHLDDAIGFPGATTYVADNIAGLGSYFSDLANRLGPHREHAH